MRRFAWFNVFNFKMSYYSTYRWCVVPECKNTSVKTPDKLWIRVPTDINMRKTWFEVGGRDPEKLSEKSTLYFCEDHFDLERDMENYMEYKIMGSVKQIRIKPHCIPSRFNCKSKEKSASNESHFVEGKRLKISLSEDYVQDHSEEDNVKASSTSIKDSQTTLDVPSLEKKCDAGQNIQVQEHIATQLPNDMSNYMEYHVMGKVGRVSIKPGVVPTRFKCQARKPGGEVTRSHIVKKLRKQLIVECEEEIERTQKELEEKAAATNAIGAEATSSADYSAASNRECTSPSYEAGPSSELTAAAEGKSSLHEELCLPSSPLHIKEEEEIEEDPLTGISPPPDVKIDTDVDEYPPSGPSSPIDPEEPSTPNIKEEQVEEDTASKVEDYEASLSKLQQEVAELKTENQRLVKENKMLTDITRNFINENLETECGQKQYIVATTETLGIINKLKDYNLKLQEEKVTVNNEVTKLKEANLKLAEDKLTLSKEVKRLGKEIEKKNKEAGKFTNVIQKLTEKNVAFLKKIKILEWEIRGLNKKILKSKDDCKMAEKNEEIQSVNENVFKLTDDNTLIEENRELNKRLQCLSKKIEDLNMEIVELKSKKNGSSEKQPDSQNSRKPQNFKEIAQIRSLTEENQSLTERIEALNEELEKCSRRRVVRVGKRRRLV